MSTKWTSEQEKAIRIRNCNTLVSAAAGSGKTAVLVQRVIDMITDKTNPVYINRLLIATFTNAAASEMKERIYDALRKKINENPEDSFLKEQLVLLGQAQISTIHAFCMNLIRENYHLLGIRHDFDIADEVKLSTLKNNALDFVMEEYYASGDEDFYLTVDAFGGKKTDDNILEIILSIYRFAESLPDPEGWLKSCYENLKNKDIISKYKNVVHKSIKQLLHGIKKEYEKALECIETDSGLNSYYDIYANECNFFEELSSDINGTNITSFSFERLPRKGKDADPVNAEYVKGVRDNAKKQFAKVYDLCLYTDDEILYEINQMLPFVRTVSDLAIRFRKRYAELKREENILDFNDLEHFAIKLLEENADLRNHMKDFYAEILVDEYQDTNGVQAYLFDMLSNGRNLFMVGDVKQSIYGFRNSNPRYFVEKYNSFSFDHTTDGIKINLAKNFRSSNAVINVVNDYFVKLMIDDLGGVTYSSDHALVYGNDNIKDVDFPVERYVINTKSDSLEDIDVDKVQAEAIFTANKIFELVEVKKPEIYDKSTNSYRKLEYKDIVILMRKTKNIASVYAEVLGHRGIPVYTEESGGYFNCVEIATVISFLKIIENPLQDIPLLAVVRSPVFGFDDNFIAELRAENKYARFYDLLKKSDNTKSVDFIQKLEDLRQFSKHNNVGAVVRKIVFDTGYYQFVGGLPNGEVRMMNLNLLCERATGFSQKGFKGVSDFISYVKTMIESENEYSLPKLISENENVVNIMSVHKSKGLEYPVVFLCESGLQFNKMDLSKPIVFDENMGIAMDIVDVKRRLKYTPYAKRAICEKKIDELIAEEIRLLYVALTRAKYKLVIVGSKAVTDFVSETLDGDSYNIKLKKSYLDMLLADIRGIPDARILDVSEVLRLDEEYVTEKEKSVMTADYSEFYDEISERLEFKYKYDYSKFVPSKKSISEVISVDDEIRLASLDVNGDNISSAQRGTLIHFVLQNIMLDNVGSADAILSQIDYMIENGIFDKEYKEVIDVEALYSFFSSNIGKRMLASKQIYREFKFCVDLPASELGYEATDETVLMQGVIDCCFVEDDEFVIIDYKTGSLKDKYKKQLELYRRCLEISTGKSVKETHIYPLI